MKLAITYTIQVTVNEDDSDKTAKALEDFVKTLGSDTNVDETDCEELEDEDKA